MPAPSITAKIYALSDTDFSRLQASTTDTPRFEGLAYTIACSDGNHYISHVSYNAHNDQLTIAAETYSGTKQTVTVAHDGTYTASPNDLVAQQIFNHAANIANFFNTSLPVGLHYPLNQNLSVTNVEPIDTTRYEIAVTNQQLASRTFVYDSVSRSLTPADLNVQKSVETHFNDLSRHFNPSSPPQNDQHSTYRP